MLRMARWASGTTGRFSSVELIDPPHVGSEHEILTGFLDYQRAVLQRKADGLDAAQLDQRLEPSTMTLGGLLKHLAYVEDWWVNQVLADNPAPEPWASVDWKADGDWEWHSAVDDTPEQLRAMYDETVATSDRIIREALARPDGLKTRSRRTLPRGPVAPVQPALDPGPPDRGVRPPPGPCRPDPRVDRRVGRRLAPSGRRTAAR